MKFLGISMEAFCSIGEMSFDFAEQGLVVVTGQNKDAEAASSNGSGKCFGRGTKILMFDGSTKTAESIVPGDRLMGDDSTPRTVLATHSGNDTLYQVQPKKGNPYVVNKEHILVFKFAAKKRRIPESVRHAVAADGSIQIAVKDYIKLPFWVRNLLVGYKAPADFPAQVVPLDPYFLGVWLGNGTTGNTEVCTPHAEVVRCIEQIASDFNLRVAVTMPERTAPNYRIVGESSKKNPLREILRSLGIFDAKAIPEIYRTNSRAIRLAILAGLLDTDGYLMPDGRTYEFSSKFLNLANDVLFIARSLGFSASIKEKFAKCQTGVVGLYYILNIGGNTDEIPTRVSYKQAKPRSINKDCLHYGIRSVDCIGRGDYFGFETDGNKLFLLDDFTVVHNSTAVVDSICWVLFGKTTKGGGVDAVTPKGGGKGTRVTLTFLQNGSTYVVTRHRRHKTGGNKLVIVKDGQDISKATASDVERQLEEILGISLETFLYTTILGQGLMFRFTQLTDQSRKEILEGIAGSAIYEAARTEARESSRTTSESVHRATTQIDAHQTMIAGMRQSLQTLHRQQAEADATYRRQVAEIDAQITDVYAQVDRESKNLPPPSPDKALQNTLREAQQSAILAHRAVGQEMDALKRQIYDADRLVESIESVGANCRTCGTPMTPEHLAQESSARRKAAEDLRGMWPKLQAKLDAAAAAASRFAPEIRKAEEQDRAIEQQIWDYKSRMSELSNRLKMLGDSKARITAPNYTTAIFQGEEQIRQTEKKVVELSDQKKYAEQELAKASFWATAFQDLRVASIDSVLSFVNSRLDHYCSILCGPDIRVRLSHTDKGKIDLGVTTAGGSYLSASGGEKDRIDICVAFALLALARQCTNWSSNILVLDEIAVFVDEAGVDRLMKLVTEMMDTVETAFMISHNPIFAGYGDKTWTVVKENGISRLETA